MKTKKKTVFDVKFDPFCEGCWEIFSILADEHVRRRCVKLDLPVVPRWEAKANTLVELTKKHREGCRLEDRTTVDLRR